MIRLPWLVAIGCAIASVVIAASAVLNGEPKAKPVAFVDPPAIGEILEAFQGVTVRETTAEGAVVCQLYSDAKLPANATWMVNVCYLDATPPVPQGVPALAG